MPNIRYFREALFLLFIVYYAQGSLYAQGSIVSQASLLLILLLCVFFLLKTLVVRKGKTHFYVAWTFLLCLNISGYIVTGEYSSPNHFSMLKGVLITLLSFYPFYYMSYTGRLTSSDLVRFFLLLLPVTILQFHFNESRLLAERISVRTDVVNNVAYAFVGLIPFAFFFKKKIFAFLSIIVIMFFIVQSAKRGAVVAGAIGLVSFFYYQLKVTDRRYGFLNVVVVWLCIIGLCFVVYDVFVNNEYLISRLERIGEDGGASGRDRIYSNIFDSWMNSDGIFKLVFGYGFAASLYLSGSGHYAHNDWLELLSNFGLLGVSVYIYLFISAVKLGWSNKLVQDNRIVLNTIIFIWFFMTLVSMFYSTSNGYVQSILLGFLVGSRDKNSYKYSN